MALFSARVVQHLALTLLAAPLLAAALRSFRALPPAIAAALFAVLFWIWHLPRPYAATLQGDLAYWAMHLSLLGTAILLWASLAAAVPRRPLAVFLALAATAGQMTALALAMLFARAVASLARAWRRALGAHRPGRPADRGDGDVGDGRVLMLAGIGWLMARFLAARSEPALTARNRRPLSRAG